MASRVVTVLLAGLVAGCAPQVVRVSTPQGVLDLDQFLASHRLADEGGIRADLVGRIESASYHVVQVLGSEHPHRHAAHDLTVLVLRGHGVLNRAAGRTPLAQGDAAVVPRGEPHWFASDGAYPAVALVIFTPPLDAPDAVPLEEQR